MKGASCAITGNDAVDDKRSVHTEAAPDPHSAVGGPFIRRGTWQVVPRVRLVVMFLEVNLKPHDSGAWHGAHAKHVWAAGCLLGIALLFVYWPILTNDYLYYDDWIHFNGRDIGCSASPMFHWHVISGRIFQGYALCGLFHMLDSTVDAWRSRLIVFFGIVAFAVLQWLYFRAVGIRWTAALCFAFGTCVLPGMLVIGYWITAGTIVPALIASTTAALLTHAAVTSKGTRARKVGLIAGACVLQVAAILSYQTEAMYFWTLTAVMLAVQLPNGPRAALRPLAIYAFVGFVPMAGYFIWFTRLSGWAGELKATEPLRGTMFTDVFGKAKWFFERALPRMSSLWLFDLPAAFGVAVLALFVVCLLLVSVRAGRMELQRQHGDRTNALLYAIYPLSILAVGIMSYAPMLATAYNVETFRSMVPMSAFLFLVGTIHIRMIVRADTWQLPIQMGAAAAFILGVACLSSDSLVSRMVLPAAAEYSFVRSSLQEATKTGHIASGVHAVIPVVTREFRTDEMNGLSAQSGQALPPMIQVMAREARLPVGPTTFSLPGEPFDREQSLVINFADLAKSGLWKSIHSGDPPSRHAVYLVTQQGYQVFAYKRRIFAVPLSRGTVRLDADEPPSLSGVVIGETVREVLGRLTGNAVTDSQPLLLRSHNNYNLVAFRGRVYGVPWSAGQLNLSDWNSGRVEKLPGVVIGANVDEVLSRLPR
jgi:hypothetical protein